MYAWNICQTIRYNGDINGFIVLVLNYFRQMDGGSAGGVFLGDSANPPGTSEVALSNGC